MSRRVSDVENVSLVSYLSFFQGGLYSFAPPPKRQPVQAILGRSAGTLDASAQKKGDVKVQDGLP